VQDTKNFLAFYIVCEEWLSMETFGIDALNRALREIHAAIADNPRVNGISHIGLIAFSDTAEELLPLSNLADVKELPGLTTGVATNYGEAFRLLRVVISRDISKFKSLGVKVYRPVVLFITGGEPTDDWKASHRALTDKNINPEAPHVIAFGVADANPAVLKEIGTAGVHFAGQEDTEVFQIGPKLLFKDVLHDSKSLTEVQDENLSFARLIWWAVAIFVLVVFVASR